MRQPTQVSPGPEFIRRFDNLEKKIDALASLLVQVIVSLNDLSRGEIIMQRDIEELSAAVVRNTDVEAAATALIQSLTAKISAALDSATSAADIAQVKSLVVSLGASSDALAAAIVANTPIEPAPVPVEPAPAEQNPVS